ncbi:transcription factor GTE4-like isoform X1 [Rhododendron vialii]|uniref:transcription factor GTE4-like isoform X1 n=1 Tax=Rhododendron vialii TaxID=182163 RepID=UPI00265EF400|nr:transcription factor GTE4-like isoform X1 [Rhododendron vialii]XP_058211127.1 transcription factor GTE4-like isoform X1 [Rhododendron vialii]
MASETLVAADEPRETRVWGENYKVYTRKKFHKKPVKNINSDNSLGPDSNDTNNGETTTATTFTAANSDKENKKKKNVDESNGDPIPEQSLQTPPTEEQTLSRVDVVSIDSSNENRDPQIAAEPNGGEPPSGDEVIKPIIRQVDDRVRINLTAARSKSEIRQLKRKLVDELDQVRSSVKKLEAAKEVIQLARYSIGGGDGGYSQTQYLPSDGRALARANSEVVYSANNGRALLRVNSEMGYSENDRRALVRVNSEVGSIGHHDSRPFQQLSVSVMENNNGFGEFVEKEKRTPKANPYYRSAEFLLGKDRLPAADSNKKSKGNGGRKHGGRMGHGFGINKYISHAFRSCNNLLARLMKHKHGWVFNEPVNASALGIHDYHDIIKHPMDLGTVKTKLGKNWYKSPREFAEDVRLTFRNAMTYNPKGQDVHVMAEELLNIFEDKWAAIEAEYSLDWRFELVHDLSLLSPTSRKAHHPPPVPPHPLAFDTRTLERAESMTMTVDSKRKPKASAGRIPVPKKPKANDPHKRDMTYEEKQRLSTHLQGLPSEKLDSIVQIIKKRSSALSQRDDEIEVDIDNVDAETLWELDRFVTNYKKCLSKNKRKAELALQRRAEATPAVPPTNPAPGSVDAQKESKKADEKNAATSPAQGERPGDVGSGSSSSSSSSSDSDSSSSDSDSDSSSANGSDAGHSSRT